MPSENSDSQENKTKKKISPKKETANETSAKDDLKSEEISKLKNVAPPAVEAEASSDTQDNQMKKGKPKRENESSLKDGLKNEETEKLEKEETETVTKAPTVIEMEYSNTLAEATELLDEKQHSRYGRVRKNRSLGPDMQMEPLVKPKPFKDSIPMKEDSPNVGNPSKKSHHPSFSKAKVDKILNGMTLTEELKLGDLIWARIPGHPWWPCMISEDPVKNNYIKSRNRKAAKDGGTTYHVNYFGKGTQRGWTVPKNILVFEGKEHLDEFVTALVNRSPDDQKDVVNFLFRVPQSRLTTWKEAVLEAEKYIQFGAEERLEKLVPIFAQGNAPKSTHSSEKATPTKDNDHPKKSPVNLGEVINKVDAVFQNLAKKGMEKSEASKLKKNDDQPILSKYRMKAYYENYLSAHLDDMIDGGLTDKEARDLLTIKWKEFTNSEKETYKKRKGNISNSKVTLPKEKLRADSTTVEPVSKKKQLAEPASKRRGNLNMNLEFKPLVKPNNIPNDKKIIKEESQEPTKNILPSDYTSLFSATKNGASPRKVAVFIVESDSSSDSGLEEDKPGVDEESEEITKPGSKKSEANSKKTKNEDTKLKNRKKNQLDDNVKLNVPNKGKPDSNMVPNKTVPVAKEISSKLVNGALGEATETKSKNSKKNNCVQVNNALVKEKQNIITNGSENEVKDIKEAHTKVNKSVKNSSNGPDFAKQISKKLKMMVKKVKSETGKSDVANSKPKRTVTEKSKYNNAQKSTEKNSLDKNHEGDSAKLLKSEESDSKDIGTSNDEKPIVPEDKMEENTSRSSDAVKEDSCLDISLFINESLENSSVTPFLASPTLGTTVSSIKNKDEEQRQQNCNEIIESVGLKKISLAEKRESNNGYGNDKGKKTGRIGTRRYVKSRMDEVDNKSRKNEERLSGVKFPTDIETGADDGPPPKKAKVQETNNKVSAKPKTRLLKNKLIEENKIEPKKKTISESNEESLSSEEHKTCNGSEIIMGDKNKSKKSAFKNRDNAAEESKTELTTNNSSKTSLPTTEAQVEDKIVKQLKGRGRPRKNKDEPPTETSAKNLPSVNQEATNENDYDPVEQNSNDDSCPLPARKRKVPQSDMDIAFNKYLHNNILDIMESNPELSYSEAKVVLVSKWEKMTKDEKVSYQAMKDDTKENVNSSSIKKAKLMLKTMEGLESEEEEIQMESVDSETGAVLLNRHERLCQICEVSGDVVTCKGPCQQNFHLGCLNNKPENLATFECDECATNCHTCFSCKSNQGEVRKCTISNCGKFYHEACLRQSPLSTLMENRIICPLHVCLSCYNENPKLARTHKGRLVRCIRCPTAFHSVESCVAAGSIQLTQSHILCTHHFIPKKSNKHHSHMNVNWCFICSAGGELICCESCPGAFHAECLEIVLPEGSFYCQDCKRRKHPTSGNIVWVKLGCYRWWPAEVCHPNGVPLNIQKLEHSVGEFPVRFFGSHDYFWVHKGRVFLFQDGDKGSRDHTSNRYLAKVFQRAVDEATVAFKNWQKTKRAREVNHSSSKPPLYKHIKSNKPVGKVQIHVPDTASLTRCECDTNAENPCARDTDCLNRLLHLECHPGVCPAGDKCQNQDFVKRNYPSAVPRKVEGRGWGLFALTNISKGQFVSEYVGELIDEEECQNRLKNMHAENDTNFYFLTIDKDRIIDAGPKGNLSRFMNHSCQPNCETQKWMVNGDTRVGLFAVEDIASDAELTFNYNLECRGNEKTKCGCGAPNCSGFIGVRPKTPAAISAEKKFKENLGKKKKRKKPVARKHDDECYRCGERGELLMCDRKQCTKSYHLFCLKLDKPPHGRWECPWHHCDSCGRPSVKLCMDCPNSYCNSHATPSNICIISGERVLCSEHKAVAVELEYQIEDKVNATKDSLVQSETLKTLCDINADE